ncbi:MAG: glycosyltransferase [Acidobacteriota bacterium]
MRLLKLGVYYSAYLQQFYKQFPALAAKDYSTQHAALMYDCFGSSNFWTKALNQLNYETCDIVANAEPMQKMWANEQGLEFDQSHWMFDIAAAQIQVLRPDVLLIADYSTVTAKFLRHLKTTCPSIRLVLGWCGAPFQDGSIFRECDIVLSCVPELVATFKYDGHRSHHVNHAFEPLILGRIDQSAPANADFVFIGSIVKSVQFHIEREKVLSQLVKETDLRIWSDLEQQQSSTRRSAAGGAVARRAAGFIFGRSNTSPARPAVDTAVKDRSQPPLFGRGMFQQLHDSRVALNTHIDISPINASNMRLFEATGVRTCLLTDWKENLVTLFEPDTEVLTYRSVEECCEKVRYILDHENVRLSVAAAGQARTLRDHNFAARAAQIDEIICDALLKNVGHRSATSQ